jgi:hypothetical protein
LHYRYIKFLDIHFRQQNRHIIYLLDNFSGHEISYKPTNIKLEWFAPNLTSYVQPLDAGIIRCVKAHYRRAFCIRALDLDAAGEANIYAINQLEVMKMANEAWNAVSVETITNCWNHTRIQHAPIPAITICVPKKNQSMLARIRQELQNYVESSTMTMPEITQTIHSLLGDQFVVKDWHTVFDALGEPDVDASTVLDSLTLPALPPGPHSLTRVSADVEADSLTADATPAPTLGRAHVSDQGQIIETELMKKVDELRTRNRLHGPPMSVEDLVMPACEEEVGEHEFIFEGGDQEIAERALHDEAVRSGEVVENDEEEEEEEVVEVSPPKVGSAELQHMCRALETASLESDLPNSGDLTRLLRRFRGELVKREMKAAKQTTVDTYFKPRDA